MRVFFLNFRKRTSKQENVACQLSKPKEPIFGFREFWGEVHDIASASICRYDTSSKVFTYSFWMNSPLMSSNAELGVYELLFVSGHQGFQIWKRYTEAVNSDILNLPFEFECFFYLLFSCESVKVVPLWGLYLPERSHCSTSKLLPFSICEESCFEKQTFRLSPKKLHIEKTVTNSTSLFTSYLSCKNSRKYPFERWKVFFWNCVRVVVWISCRFWAKKGLKGHWDHDRFSLSLIFPCIAGKEERHLR